MQPTQTIQAFLQASGAQYRIIDLGRRVLKIEKGLFEKIENAQAPYPYPLQRQAWFAVLFWDPKNIQQHHIWFLKLPLDEQGYLDLNARDDFLRRALEQLGQALLDSKENAPEAPALEIKDNPWSFTPRQDKMAAFHAKALVELKRPGSQHLAPMMRYLEQPEQFSQWQHIGIQGIADLCARSNEESVTNMLRQHLPQLPAEVMVPLLLGLENESISHLLTQAVIACKQSMTSDTTLLAAIIRALSGSVDQTAKKQFILDALDSYKQAPISIEVLVAISGRAWEVLTDDAVALLFVEALAYNDAGQGAFNQVLTDLLFMPSIGKSIRQAFRSPKRSERLGEAIGTFLGEVH
ncbi:MAG: hypothetical protein COA99_03325 [Moraxellaceae bacterium]|nr:MAG: hypothetical protein COA99_03325 [Moraxellaceae bacterium]